MSHFDPGITHRLIHFVSHNIVSFASCKYFILDQDDGILDVRFILAIEQMLHHKTLSATFP